MRPAVALTFLLAAPAINPAVLVSTAGGVPGQPRDGGCPGLRRLGHCGAGGGSRLARGERLRLEGGPGRGHGVAATQAAERVVMVEAPREVYG